MTAGLGALAVWECRRVASENVVHRAVEVAALTEVSSAALALLAGVDVEVALAGLAQDMRSIFPVASGSGVTIGWAFPGCAAGRMFPSVDAAYAALVAGRA